MTEKVESIEIYPMRGHSRGEWYGTLKDIADSDDNAEYWALFGVTHRGNKHCLGEFPTRTDAEVAKGGMSLNRTVRPAAASRRTIVQIEVVPVPTDAAMVEIFALCDDGTIWHRGLGVRRGSGLQEDRWERISLDGLNIEKTDTMFRGPLAEQLSQLKT